MIWRMFTTSFIFERKDLNAASRSAEWPWTDCTTSLDRPGRLPWEGTTLCMRPLRRKQAVSHHAMHSTENLRGSGKGENRKFIYYGNIDAFSENASIYIMSERNPEGSVSRMRSIEETTCTDEQIECAAIHKWKLIRICVKQIVPGKLLEEQVPTEAIKLFRWSKRPDTGTESRRVHKSKARHLVNSEFSIFTNQIINDILWPKRRIYRQWYR